MDLGDASTAPLLKGLQILHRRIGWIIGFTAVVVVVVVAGSALSTRYYAATATVEISPDAPHILEFNEVREVGAGAQWARQFQAYYQTQYEILSSRQVLGAALIRLQDEHAIDLFAEAPDPIGALRGHVEVQPSHETHLVKITVELPDPDQAALAANAIADSYMAHNLSKTLQATRDAETWLTTQQEQYRAAKHDRDAELITFRTEHELLTGPNDAPQPVAHLQRLQDSWSSVRANRVRLEGQLDALDRLDRAGDVEALASHMAANNEVIGERMKVWQELAQEQQQLLQRYTEAHPKVVEATAALAVARTQLAEAARVELAGRHASLRVVRDEEARLHGAIDEAQDVVRDMGGTLAELELLEAEAERTEAVFRSLDRRRTEVGLAQAAASNNVSVLDRAVARDNPVRPRILLNALAALVAGLLGGGALAFLVETLDASIRTGEDVERWLDLPLLAFVPRVDGKPLQQWMSRPGRGAIVHALPRSPVAEAVRSIRTSLQLARRSEPVDTVLVTSTVPLEGKSFLSANLAAMVAMAGGRVLLIDADLRRPSSHKLFGVDNERGLADILRDEASLDDVVLKTEVEGLDLLPAGRTDDPAELLDARTLQEVLDGLSRRYAMIVVDSSPVGLVADGLLWASVVDATIMVVDSDRARRGHAARTAQQLRAANPRVLGAVLNKVTLNGSRRTYAYQAYVRGEPTAESA